MHRSGVDLGPFWAPKTAKNAKKFRSASVGGRIRPDCAPARVWRILGPREPPGSAPLRRPLPSDLLSRLRGVMDKSFVSPFVSPL